MTKAADLVGSRWRFSDHGTLYEVVGDDGARRPPKDGYVYAKMVSAQTNLPIGGFFQLNIKSLGTTYRKEEAK